MTDDRYGPMRRFTKSSPESGEADPLLCRYLRTKTWFAPDAFGQGDPRQSPSGPSERIVFKHQYCAVDGDLVIPEACTDERACFEAETSKGGES